MYLISAETKKTNPSRTYFFPVRNIVKFGKMSCPAPRKMTCTLIGEVIEAGLIFGKFDIQDDSTLISHIPLLG